MNEAEINYTKAAFLHPWNLTFLTVAMLLAFVTTLFAGTPEWLFQSILLFTAAGELLYLGTMPRQDRFRRAIKAQRIAEHAKPPSQKEVFQRLTRASQRRYAKLRQLERDIMKNYRKLRYASQGMLDSHLKKIDGLLDSYISLLYQKERYEYSSQTATEREVVQAIADLRRDMEDDSAKVRSIKQRRLRILEQRLERFKRGRENLEIIEAQLETIEDVTKYIHEQSLTLRNPEEITFQLDTLLSEVEETQVAVEELEEVFASPSELLGDMDMYDSDEISTSPERSQVRE